MKYIRLYLIIPILWTHALQLNAQHRLSGNQLQIAQNAANQGDKHAQLLMGMHFLSISNKGSFKKDARKWLKRSADQGQMEAQYQYAKEIYRDKSPEQDKISLYYFEKSASQGHYKAALQAAEMYYFGFGTLRFPNKAYALFKICADSGSAKAQYYTAVMLYKGEGVQQNRSLAFKWCGKSSDQNYPPAQLLLAKMYISGSGVQMNKNKAGKLTKLAYENGEIEAIEIWDKHQLWKHYK